MAESYLGEIRIFAGTFAPLRWAFCNGQLVTIAQNGALFSLIGTTYGGDGRTTFGVPDMRGRIPVHHGTGPGLTSLNIGEIYGTEEVTLTASEIPSHDHGFQASPQSASSSSPEDRVLASVASPDALYTMTPDPSRSRAKMNANSVLNSGHSLAHPNMMAYQALNFILSLAGTYPSRN